MRIPITMCHGLHPPHLTAEHFKRLVSIAANMGFESVNYDQLAQWRAGRDKLPAKPIMFDFDHPEKTIGFEIKDILANYGFKGNLFVNTGPMVPSFGDDPTNFKGVTTCLTWDEIGHLADAGWTIGAHTHTHPNLSELFLEDPTGQKLLDELQTCDSLIEKNLGILPRDFAFTGTSWSSKAEELVKHRYRFGRLWITFYTDCRGSMYQADGKYIRYAEFVGVPGDDEPDGGPPAAARYITAESDPYRLPSMEIMALIFSEEAFRKYLQGALE